MQKEMHEFHVSMIDIQERVASLEKQAVTLKCEKHDKVQVFRCVLASLADCPSALALFLITRAGSFILALALSYSRSLFLTRARSSELSHLLSKYRDFLFPRLFPLTEL